jgi:FAD/FMN-containing dehydrogenase
VRAGTRWHHVIRTLDPLGFSVAVMQSNSDFSVGGTLSVNAHSWPVRYGPFGTSVRAFIPPERFGDFLTACREIIPPSKQDLLNVTLRYVDTDPVSVLSFAPAPRIAAVLLFSQGVSNEADRAMAALTEKLIDAVLAIGGSFYLPYRLHARVEQVQQAYPRLDAFIAKKREYDPQLQFRNLMWDRYLNAQS